MHHRRQCAANVYHWVGVITRAMPWWKHATGKIIRDRGLEPVPAGKIFHPLDLAGVADGRCLSFLRGFWRIAMGSNAYGLPILHLASVQGRRRHMTPKGSRHGCLVAIYLSNE